MQRQSASVVIAYALTVLCPWSASAGLYNTAEPVEAPRFTAEGVKPLPYSQFRNVLTDYLNLGVEQNQGPKRKHYLDQTSALLAKTRAGSATVQERVNLGEYLIRLRRFEEAVEVLTAAGSQDRRNFMIFANLAAAHELAGRPDRALGYLEQARDLIPAEQAPYTADQMAWFKSLEKYQYKLLRQRLRSSMIPRGGSAPTQVSLDDIFGDDKAKLRFEGESGKYEAGKLAAKERAKLPPDAMAVVQQLLIWNPGTAPGMEDTRLFWLLGELYNAQGDLDAAAQIFEKCEWSHRLNAPELREHRRLVQEARPKPEPFPSGSEQAAANSADNVNIPAFALPDTRKFVLVGGLAAVLLFGFVYLQVREMRRRRKAS